VRTHRFCAATAACAACVLLAIAPHAKAQGYTDIIAIQNTMTKLAADNNTLVSVDKLKDNANVVVQTQGGRQVAGGPNFYNIFFYKIGSSDKNNLLVTGTLHAREWISAVCVLNLAAFIVAQKDNQAADGSQNWPNDPLTNDGFKELAKSKEMNLKKLLGNATIYMVPVCNPAGYAFSFDKDPQPATNANPGWRKNRRDVSADIQLTTANGTLGAGGPGPKTGVDLNRNFPCTTNGVKWGQLGRRANGIFAGANISNSRDITNFDLYCGSLNMNTTQNVAKWGAAGDTHTQNIERETDGVTAFVVKGPAKNPAGHIDIHSFTGMIGWPEIPSTTAKNVRPDGGFDDDAVYKDLGRKASRLVTDPVTTTAYIDQVEGAQGGFPATAGCINDWMYENNAAGLSFLIEVGKANFRPNNPSDHAKAIMPGEFFMMFCAIDKTFSAKPKPKMK
jgi:hypothetical protein